MTFPTAAEGEVAADSLLGLREWISSFADDFPNKLLATLLPISAFVAVGLDNSVASMLLSPLGLGATVAAMAIKAFVVGNLLPVSFGYILGAVVLVAYLYKRLYVFSLRFFCCQIFLFLLLCVSPTHQNFLRVISLIG